ncbi:prenyltransferase/squalene oxidase repeat-containing protein [Streptomyces harbinensis]|uniref:prenyltransferase/squalene oxidase repeat-containing protein n=1 Tax=Streptomyces harbinensis TaxID=1176198 RepID=UPI0036876A9D
MTTHPTRAGRLRTAIDAAAHHLLTTLHPDGTWYDTRPALVPGTAAAVIALHTADPEHSAALVHRGTDWLLRTRNPDGGWPVTDSGPSNVIATAGAVAALHLAAPGRTTEAVRAGLAHLDHHGGVDGVADPTVRRLTGLLLALARLREPTTVPSVPTALLLLPTPLTRHLLSLLITPFAALTLLQHRLRPGPLAGRTTATATTILRECEQQEGGVGSLGSGDPWLTGLAATALHHAGTAPALVRATVAYLRAHARPDGSWVLMHGMTDRDVDLVGHSLATEALCHAGHRTDPRVRRAAAWLLDCRQTGPFPLFDCPPGGWAWSGAQGWPNVLDTTAALGALAATRSHGQVLADGAGWLRSRQDRRGSWSVFTPNTRCPADRSCPHATALAIDLITAAGTPATDRAVRRALRWLTVHAHPDGSHQALWHRGGVPATAAVLHTCTRLRLTDTPLAGHARAWLLTAQLADGSWGAAPATGPGTTDETARAVQALAHLTDDPVARTAAARGTDWLLAAQRPDGTWEPGPVCWYIKDHLAYPDHLIAQGLALGALAAHHRSAPPGDRG